MGTLSYGIGSSSYFDRAKQGQVFSALGLVTSPVIYSTKAGTGGPLLWNNTGGVAGSQRVLAVILAVGVGITTASGAASVLGLTGAAGQTSAPTSTTAIDAVGNTNVGGPAQSCNVYRIGTPANAGGFFQPTHTITTSAVTAGQSIAVEWVDIGGAIVVPPGSWAAVSAGVTATSAVLQVGLLWAEIPY